MRGVKRLGLVDVARRRIGVREIPNSPYGHAEYVGLLKRKIGE